MARVRAMLALRVCRFGSYGSSTFGVSSLSLLLLLAPLTLTLGHSVIASRTMNRFDIPCLFEARQRSRLIYGALSLSLSLFRTSL